MFFFYLWKCFTVIKEGISQNYLEMKHVQGITMNINIWMSLIEFGFQENAKFSKQLKLNAELRKQIDTLRRERAQFDVMYNKLVDEHKNLKQDLSKWTDYTTEAFKQRSVSDNVTNVLIHLTLSLIVN